jgi:hypothetical protein
MPARAVSAKRRFLDAFAHCGTCTGAAKLSGVDDRRHRQWLEESEQYRKDFQVAKDRAADTLEAEARRRACEGYDDPIFFQGMQVGSVKRYSDLLMIFLLKAARPDTFRDYHSVNVKGSLDTHATVTVIHEFRDRFGDVLDAQPIPPQLPDPKTSEPNGS